MPIEAKICGLTTADAVDAAVAGGAAMCGFVFFPPSPRALTPEAAAPLIGRVPDGVARVGLSVDADNALLAAMIEVGGVDTLQLHGHESVARVAEVKARFGVPVIKVLPIAGADDVAAARAYEDVADRLMFDAKPPKDATRPGGNAVAFDWTLLAGETWSKPWILAGGLTPENVALAVRASGASAVDVSSGVEDAPGRKNLNKIAGFLAAVKALSSQ